MTRIIAVRHGETDYSSEDRYAGRRDIALNGHGILQARLLAEILSKYQIDMIVTSPLKRALQTAEIIAEHNDIPLDVMDQFIERGLGVYEGLSRDEVRMKYPELVEQQVTHRKDAAPYDGETVYEVEERVSDGLNAIYERYPQSTILVVSHALVAKTLHHYFNNLSEDEFWSYYLNSSQLAEYWLDKPNSIQSRISFACAGE